MNQVTTVLSAVKRLHYLPSQIESIKEQTVDSDISLIWHNDEPYNLEYPAVVYKNGSDYFNSLYGRFYNSLHIKTPYVFIVDDDILPGKKYLERCIEYSKSVEDNVVISTFGVTVNPDNITYYDVRRTGVDTFLNTPLQVDMGGEGWFMKTELLQHFLRGSIIEPSNGEDLHFSFSLHSVGIPIVVLDKDKKDKDTWQDLTLGRRGADEFGLHRTDNEHYIKRDKLLKLYATKGWKFNKGLKALI
tara:strand:+ start:1440 stop:2174 length:735 start_codon:yes stop_codon:yes gene_type:complete